MFAVGGLPQLRIGDTSAAPVVTLAPVAALNVNSKALDALVVDARASHVNRYLRRADKDTVRDWIIRPPPAAMDWSVDERMFSASNVPGGAADTRRSVMFAFKTDA